MYRTMTQVNIQPSLLVLLKSSYKSFFVQVAI